MRGDADASARGLLDTNILILWGRLAHDHLPRDGAISAISLGELAAGVHALGPDAPDGERADRVDLLQRVESVFEPLPFDASAARAFGRIAAAVRQRGRSPRGRIADLMIAAVAAANGLPLYTTDPDDFAGLDGIVAVKAVPRP